MQVKTKNMVVGALVVLLVGTLWYRVVYSSMESKASKAKTAMHDAETQSANLRQSLSASTSPKKKTADISSKAMLAAVPSDTAEATFLREIDAIRVSSGADWQTITPSTPTPSVGVTTVNVAITAQGSEDAVARYIAELSTMKRVFVVDSISITPSGSTTAAGSSAAAAQGHAGAVFIGSLDQLTVSGRIFSSSVVPTPTATGASGAATTPASGAPTGGSGSPTGTVNG